MLGGMMGVMQAEAAVTAALKPGSYPRFSISGTRSLHSMAASAAPEPETPPIMVDSSTLTWPRPPVMWPTRASARAMSREEMPE